VTGINDLYTIESSIAPAHIIWRWEQTIILIDYDANIAAAEDDTHAEKRATFIIVGQSKQKHRKPATFATSRSPEHSGEMFKTRRG